MHLSLSHVESASSLSLPLSLSLSLFSLIIYLFYFHSYIFSLFFFLLFHSLFFRFFSSPLFFLFFSARQNQHHPWYGMNLLRGAHRTTPTLFCLTTTKSKFVVSLSPTMSRQLGVPSVQLVQSSYSRALYVPCSSNPILKMVSDKNTRRCILSKEHVLAFYCLAKVLFYKTPGYLPTLLVYGHKLDHGGFPVAAMISDVNPSYTTDCRSIDSSCKVSAKVQQDVPKYFDNHEHLHPTIIT